MENITLIMCIYFLIAAIASCFIVSACSKVKKINKDDMTFEFDFDTVNMVVKE